MKTKSSFMNPVKYENLNSKTYINMSVIVPIYNVEEYLPNCIDSLLNQKNLSLEIILVNDGSTDNSGLIANQYANRYEGIKVIHQENGGASAARNAGLKIAQGEYIAFIDSDDWVNQDSLGKLYQKAIEYQADVLMGNTMKYYREGVMLDALFFQPIPKDVFEILMPGKAIFVRLSKVHAYPPTPCNYIYRRNYLDKIQARFEEGIMYEDELWCPIFFYHAKKFIVVDIDFYNYRQREGSVMHASNRRQRMKALFRVSDLLVKFAEHLDFSEEDREFKSWLYVTIFRIYSEAFKFLSQIKDTSYDIPEYHLDRIWHDCSKMMPEPQRTCGYYYHLAVTALEKYVNWSISELVTSIATQIKTGKRSILIYNAVRGETLSLKNEIVPDDWLITTDRRYFQQADVVVFYLPDLAQEVEDDLEKPEGQIWVTWHLVETEKNFPWINDPEFKELFDLQVYYPENEKKKEHPVIQLCRTINDTLYQKQ